MAAVEGMFEQLDYPVDVIWLDIEHTDGKRYFTVSNLKSFIGDIDCCFSFSRAIFYYLPYVLSHASILSITHRFFHILLISPRSIYFQ